MQMLHNKSMKIVIPYSRGRISPVFDVAEHFYLIDIKDSRELSRQELDFTKNEIFAKARMFSKLNVNVVICGAISGIQENILKNAGIQLLMFICGDLEEVLDAFIQGSLVTGAFQMPGYCKGRRRHGYGYCGGKHNLN